MSLLYYNKEMSDEVNLVWYLVILVWYLVDLEEEQYFSFWGGVFRG
jgi:hypothetical protein